MPDQIRLLKEADRLVGGVIASLLPSARGRFSGYPRILLIRPGGIGDAVLLIPAIQAIRKNYPQASIDILAEKRNGAVFTLCPDVGRLFHYDRPGQLLDSLCRRYDVVIDTEQWHRLSAVVARLTGARLLAGFASNARRRLFNHAASYAHERYEADSFFDLLAPLGIARPESFPIPFLEVPLEAMATAGELLADLAGKPFITLFPGASIPERRWGAERFRPVAEHLSRAGYGVVVVGGAADSREGEAIVAGGLGLNLAGCTSLVETAAVIDRSALLVSGDSGVLHIAVGLGKPTVSLFGPGIAEKWAPRGARHIVINKSLHCSPCTKFGTTPRCPRGAECMREITVGEVAAAVGEVLKKEGAREYFQPIIQTGNPV